MTFAHLIMLGLFLLGFWCVLTETDLIKIVVGFNIMEASLLLLLVKMAYVPGGRPPILFPAAPDAAKIVDPIPQALTLTAIVIGAATTALMLSLIVQLHRHYGTTDLDELREIR